MKNFKCRYFIFDEMVMTYSDDLGSIYSFFGKYEMDERDNTNSEIMLFTGFVDDFGKGIYEYDYLLVDGKRYIVLFENGRFILKDKKDNFMNIQKIMGKEQVVITGNYFENTFKTLLEPLAAKIDEFETNYQKIKDNFRNKKIPLFLF